MSLFSDKKIAGLRYMTGQLLKNRLWDKLICAFTQSYCLKFVCDRNEARV